MTIYKKKRLPQAASFFCKVKTIASGYGYTHTKFRLNSDQIRKNVSLMRV
jgi:hypothetical protein